MRRALNPVQPEQLESEECITKNLNIYTLQTLYNQPLEPVDFLVDGLLSPELYILGGSPKVAKSWLALQFYLAVYSGSTFLGSSTKKHEGLYLDLKDGPQRFHTRALHLELCKKNPHLKRILVLPFRGYRTRWTQEW